MNNMVKTNLAQDQERQFKSSESGSKHWLKQRITALLLVILTSWLFYFSYLISHAGQSDEIIIILQKPVHLLGLIFFLTTSLYHACLGIEVIIEDYIHNQYGRVILTFIANSLSVVTMLIFLLTIIQIMII